MSIRPPRGIAAENKMFNNKRPTVTLVVESGYDQRFWRTYCAATNEGCLVRQMGQGGRKKALEALNDVAGQPDVYCVAVLDADLDRLQGCLVNRSDVILTDAHDLETTLLLLPTLQKLLRRYLDPEKLQKLEARWGESFETRLFQAAKPLALLRWLKILEWPNLDELKFRKPRNRLRYDRCTAKDWAPSATASIGQVINFSGAHHLKSFELEARCKTLPEVKLAQLCNGHDLVGLLTEAFKLFSNEKQPAEEWAERLATACERRWLQGTEMWKGLQAWEATHPGFHILSAAA